MYLNMTTEQVISQLYKKWSGDGDNDAIIAATSLLERVRATVGEHTKVSDGIVTMNHVAVTERNRRVGIK